MTATTPKAIRIRDRTHFSFPLPEQLVQAASATAGATVTVTTLTGDPLPSWLKFVPETNTFVASAVPDGALPIQLLVIIGGQRAVVVISERAE